MDLEEQSEPTTDENGIQVIEGGELIGEPVQMADGIITDNEDSINGIGFVDLEHLSSGSENGLVEENEDEPEEPVEPIDPLMELEDEGIQADAQQEPEDAGNQGDDEDESDGIELPDEPETEEPNGTGRRWYIPANHVHAAIRELVVQNRRGEGRVSSSMLNRSTFMHRLRRVVFAMDRVQHQRLALDSNNDNEFLIISDNLNPLDNEEHDEQNISAATAEQRAIEEAATDAVRFDTNLPAEHAYLGVDMDRVSGVNYLDVGKTYYMVLFMHQHILFPGEVLPFMISGGLIEANINTDNGILFGICFPSLHGNEQDVNVYGVTCQIYEKGTDARGNTVIKSRALQRFVTRTSEFSSPIQFIAGQPQLKCYGRVKILPEIYLPEPLRCINMGSMNRFRDNASMKQTYKRFQAASTPWPAHVYDDYSIGAFVEKAKAQLAQHKIDTMPTDPIQLSFWLVRNLHLSDDMMKTIFITDSVNTRLKIISSTFREDAIFTCRYCGNRIANCRELFAMSKHGVQTQYCNSAGYIHKTNTVYQLLREAILYNGKPSTEYSWFPGYQWHIIVCKVCTRHIGWEFKAVETNLVPKKFFGISSSSVRVSTPLPKLQGGRAAIYRSFMRLAQREMQ